jgi:hypothetical protein
MYKDMDPHERELSLKVMRHRYPELGLSDEQAVKMLELEDSVNVSSFDVGRGLETFSVWEQQVYELDTARSFLTDEQLASYEKRQRTDAEEHEAHLKDQDTGEAKEVVLSEEYAKWLKEDFLPTMRREMIHVPIVFFMEKEKIAYLRAEYQRYLAVSRQNALVSHYRQFRGFAPNNLKIRLLREERLGLLPAYEQFILGADEAVKSVGAFLLDKYRSFAEQGEEFFLKKSEESKKQHADMRMKHIGERQVSGWHVSIKPKNDLDLAQHWLMSMMLMNSAR